MYTLSTNYTKYTTVSQKSPITIDESVVILVMELSEYFISRGVSKKSRAPAEWTCPLTQL